MTTLTQLCCLTRAALFNLAVGPAELTALEAWPDDDPPHAWSRQVWSRGLLDARCRQEPEVAQRLTDVLDLAHAEAVLSVRACDEQQVTCAVDAWCQEPSGETLPGLLWGLCSDPREAVRAQGQRLAHEALTHACRHLVEAD